jgi:ABC-type amino acid transport substrate-binding protein
LRATIVVASVIVIANPAVARGLAEIRKSKELRICHPTLSTLSRDKQTQHPHVKTAEAFARFLKVTPKLREVRWNAVFEDVDGRVYQDKAYTPGLLANGSCDLFPSDITILNWRQTKLAFAPIYASRKMIITRRDEVERFVNVLSLAGRKTITQPNTTYAEWLEQQNRELLRDKPVKVSYQAAAHPMEDVRRGASDFAVVDAYSALSAIRESYQDLAVAFPVGMTEQIAWAFAKGDRDLLERFQEFFLQGTQDGGSEINRFFRVFYGIDLRQINELTYLVINKS